jgi:hypothetical protein
MSAFSTSSARTSYEHAVALGPILPDMNKTEATAGKGKITRQGVRDLNYYGPRPSKGVAGDPVGASDGTAAATSTPGETGKSAETGEPRAPAQPE